MDRQSEISWAIVASGVLAVFTIGLYRLFFHPLSKVPGPKLAALTGLYEFHYECIKQAKFAFQIKRLHEQYGPIIRINPNEVHIADPEFFDKFHNISNKLDKYDWYYEFIGAPDSAFGTTDHELHRVRRKPIARYFSPSALSKLEATIRQNVLKLCERLDGFKKAGNPVNLSNAFRCLAADTVTWYGMPKGFNMLDSTDFANEYNSHARTLSYIAVFHRHFPVIIPLFMLMPRWLVNLTSTKGGLQMYDFQTDLADQAAELANSPSKSDTTVLGGLASSSDLSPSDKTAKRLAQEARILVGAGVETTGSTLEHLVFSVLANPDVHSTLRSELASAGVTSSTLPPYSTLRTLTYLSATINEALRLGLAVSGRLPRISRHKAFVYDEHVLPPGTVISSSLRHSHFDPRVFPDPSSFKPERWLEAKSQSEHAKLMERNLVPFGRGSRSCVGKDLAVMVLYLETAAFFGGVGRSGQAGTDDGKADVKIFETDRSDLEMEYDLFAPFPKKDSKGLKVLFEA